MEHLLEINLYDHDKRQGRKTSQFGACCCSKTKGEFFGLNGCEGKMKGKYSMKLVL